MISDYNLWMSEPEEKESSGTLYEMITKAQHEKLKEFKYVESGETITVKLEELFPRPAEMLYGERYA